MSVPVQPTRQGVGERQSVSDLEALYRQHGAAVWRAVYAFAGGRRDIADDAVAEAFAQAIAYRARIRDPLPWLYRVAFRTATRELRRRPHDAQEDTGQVDDYRAVELAVITNALAQLPPKQRAVLFLHYHADLPVRDIARLTGSSVPAVKVTLHRGRARLRTILKPN
jgi:RNA polymerase sigma-70 factor, ECF subfamily